jgi:hypothetical protein
MLYGNMPHSMYQSVNNISPVFSGRLGWLREPGFRNKAMLYECLSLPNFHENVVYCEPWRLKGSKSYGL